AKLLTYRDETRREGITTLAALARDPTIGKDAAAGWRQALLWLTPTERDVALYRDWLRAHPKDMEVKLHLERARNAATIREGFAALDRGGVREAEAALRAAIDGAVPEERWHARLALADLMLESGRPSEAETNLREVLASVPDEMSALRSLAGLLVQQRRFEEAIPINERLAKVAPQYSYRAGWLRAEMLRTEAAKSRQAHEYARARQQLGEAREADPSDVWVLHDLTNVLLQLNALPEAQSTVAALLRLAPELPEARVAQARVLAAAHQDIQALAILRSLSPPPRDPAVLALRRRLEFQVRIPPALELAITGRRDEAVRELEAMEA